METLETEDNEKEETLMISQIVISIQNDMIGILDKAQMKQLSEVLTKHLSPLEPSSAEYTHNKNSMLPVFISAKRVEGCSEKSLRYYESTIRNMLENIDKPECQITTGDLRSYLDTYQRRGTVSKVTLDNVRRILSSFFAWLEDEDALWYRQYDNPSEWENPALFFTEDACQSIIQKGY